MYLGITILCSRPRIAGLTTIGYILDLNMGSGISLLMTINSLIWLACIYFSNFFLSPFFQPFLLFDLFSSRLYEPSPSPLENSNSHQSVPWSNGETLSRPGVCAFLTPQYPAIVFHGENICVGFGRFSLWILWGQIPRGSDGWWLLIDWGVTVVRDMGFGLVAVRLMLIVFHLCE